MTIREAIVAARAAQEAYNAAAWEWLPLHSRTLAAGLAAVSSHGWIPYPAVGPRDFAAIAAMSYSQLADRWASRAEPVTTPVFGQLSVDPQLVHTSCSGRYSWQIAADWALLRVHSSRGGVIQISLYANGGDWAFGDVSVTGHIAARHYAAARIYVDALYEINACPAASATSAALLRAAEDRKRKR